VSANAFRPGTASPRLPHGEFRRGGVYNAIGGHGGSGAA